MDALTTPSNWQKVRLGDIAEINPPTIIPNVFYYIDLESVEKGQLLNKQLMIKNKAPSRARRLLSKNDILYQLVRPYQRNNYFFTLNGNYVASTGYAQIRTLQNPSFLYFALLSNYFVNAVLDRCEGTSYPAISSNELKKCEVILPPLNEQAAIANVLSDVDRYLYSLDALILKKEGVKKALRIKMLNQILASNGVEFKKIGEICLIKRGRVIAKKVLQENGKYPVYSSQTLNNGILGFIDTYDFDGEFLTWTTDGAYAGSVFYRNGRFSITNVCGLLQPIQDNILHKYLYYILQVIAPLHVNPGMGNPKLMSVAMQQIKIPLPPLNEQAAIANILSDLDSEIISLKNKKRQFENIKKALNHDLMSAKIRVLKK
ncbi:restriction endonuclease subunit S [Helicobacter pylori]|nr:restriction endonuclease subunit S [Helicobacter pylori]